MPSTGSNASGRAVAVRSLEASGPPALNEVRIVVPASVERASERRPFVLFLHGFGGSGASLAADLALERLADRRRFVFAAPDGARNLRGQRYWNASSACCDFDEGRPSHVAELAVLLRRAARHPRVDPQRIFAVGYSNGGFMAHRLACDVPELRGIVSVAGAGPNEIDPPCRPTHEVRVLELHGDRDDVVRFEGGTTVDDITRLLAAPPFARASRARHPSAANTVRRWAALEGCLDEPVEQGSSATITLGTPVDAIERLAFQRCAAPVELWIVRGGDHFVAINAAAQEALVSYLFAVAPR